ncbi:MAG: 16S rRNA (guanine(527)-N(7))-methyltransferase RsmG [Proteobacteria bacterium]|nr:16S rRNA (guanine(527)-N(7))-methyltransferase RsmG [Pseudomonadota bacterium]MDA1132744.1 16S rRNA (guanine(527)-N(7))-methyltransferase RsmG [Pseudomonadota bacterium]
MEQFGPDEFRTATGVSRETLERLVTLVELTTEQNRTLNLVAASTVADVWHRHVYDSAQLAALATGDIWLDIGSGAGFPGLVLAILGVGEVHLVERGARKAAFLGTAAQATGARAVVHGCPVEEIRRSELGSGGADVVTARAVARPDRILELSAPLAARNAVWLLPAGRGAAAALTEAQKSWTLAAETLPSRTDPDSGILRLRMVARGRNRTSPRRKRS